MTSREQARIDEKQVIDELIKDPSANISSLAEKCKMSKPKVWRIIRKLEENGGIHSRGAILNVKKMGKRSFIVLYKRTTKPLDKDFADVYPNFLAAVKGKGITAVIEDSYLLTGAFDWLSIVTVDNQEDLMRFLEIWRKNYSGYGTIASVSEIAWLATRNSIEFRDQEELLDLVSRGP